MFQCVLCGDLFEDKSSKDTDTDICASCGYDNSMNATNSE